MASEALKALEIIHEEDPAAVIMRDIEGYLDNFQITGKDILAIVYQRGEVKTKGGILTPKGYTDREDRFQGKAGLVVKIGPLVHEERAWFGDCLPEVGDWIMFDINTTFPFLLGKSTARLVEARFIRGIIPRPDMIY